MFIASAGHRSDGANAVRAFRARHAVDVVADTDLILDVEQVEQSAMMRSFVERQTDNSGSSMIAASGDLPKQVAVNNRSPFLMTFRGKGSTASAWTRRGSWTGRCQAT